MFSVMSYYIIREYLMRELGCYLKMYLNKTHSIFYNILVY